MKPPDDIIVLALRAITGEVTGAVRAIGFGYSGKFAKFLFYMEKPPTEYDRENAEIIAVNFDAGYPTKLEQIDVEFVFTEKPFGKLDFLDFCIFGRSE